MSFIQVAGISEFLLPRTTTHSVAPYLQQLRWLSHSQSLFYCQNIVLFAPLHVHPSVAVWSVNPL